MFKKSGINLLTLWLLSYQWIAIVIQALISFGLSIIVARFLGIELFGVYVIATTAGNFLRVLIDGGFTTLLQRESAKNSLSPFIDNNKLAGYAQGYAFLVMLALFSIALINPFNQNRDILFAIIVAFTPIVLVELSMCVLRGQGRLARDAILQVISRSITAFFIIFVLFFGFVSPTAVLFAQAIGGFMIYFILAYRSKFRPLFLMPLHLFKTLIPLLGGAFAVVVYARSDLLLCKIFDVLRSDVGSYGLACRLIEALQVFVAPVAFILFRKFRLLYEHPKEVLIRNALKSTNAALFIGAIICAVAFLFAPIVVPKVFGDQYTGAVSLFEVLAIGFIFFLGNTVLFQSFVALEQQRLLMICTVYAAIFNVTLNVLLIPIYGVIACAWISVLTQCLLTFLLRFYLHKQVNK